jgi:hypothetical protein
MISSDVRVAAAPDTNSAVSCSIRKRLLLMLL